MGVSFNCNPAISSILYQSHVRLILYFLFFFFCGGVDVLNQVLLGMASMITDSLIGVQSIKAVAMAFDTCPFSVIVVISSGVNYGFSFCELVFFLALSGVCFAETLRCQCLCW